MRHCDTKCTRTLCRTSHESLPVKWRTVTVWLERHCAVTDVRGNMARMARRSRRHDGRGSSNGAEVTDAPAPFARKNRRVARHTAT